MGTNLGTKFGAEEALFDQCRLLTGLLGEVDVALSRLEIRVFPSIGGLPPPSVGTTSGHVEEGCGVAARLDEF